MTAGRSGSTSLMDRLARFDDIAMPIKDVDCRDNELLHPQFAPDYSRAYSGFCGTVIDSPHALIEGFYTYHAKDTYAGFKSMPERHEDFDDFVRRPDIQHITLLREDVASTIASFVIAKLAGTWRRFGEPQRLQWRFDPERGDNLLGTINYILDSNAAIKRMPNAIQLNFEALCSPHFNSTELNDFFGREIRLDNPRPPVHGSTYVDNWDKFEKFVAEVAEKQQNDCTSS
jgi:hypothetical protein